MVAKHWHGSSGVTIPEGAQEGAGSATWCQGLVHMIVFDDLGGFYQPK